MCFWLIAGVLESFSSATHPSAHAVAGGCGYFFLFVVGVVGVGVLRVSDRSGVFARAVATRRPIAKRYQNSDWKRPEKQWPEEDQADGGNEVQVQGPERVKAW